MRQLFARDGAVIIDEVPRPATPEKGYLIESVCSLISPGTELGLIAASKDGQTRRLGYSVVGRVLESGAGAPPLAEGTLVACAGFQWSSHAELVAVPHRMVTVVPESVSPIDATFTTLGATSMHSLRQAQLALGERVVVIGLGVVGQLAARIALAAGADVLGIDRLAERRRHAEKLGVVSVAAPPEGDPAAVVRSWSNGRGADCVVFCTSGADGGVVDLACEMARDRGVLVVTGTLDLRVPRDAFFDKELTLRIGRAYGPGRYDPVYEEEGIDYPIGYVRWTQERNRAEFLRLLARGLVDVSGLISHQYDFADAVKAYDELQSPTGASMGVVLNYAGT